MADSRPAAAPADAWSSMALTQTVIDIERHAASSGWDIPPRLFALVDTGELLAREPHLSALGLATPPPTAKALTPVEQEDLADGPLDEVLATISWPPQVLGCALVQEVLMLPPSAEEELPSDVDPSAWAAARADRREARLVVGVLRDGSRAAALRLRPVGETAGAADVLTGPDLAPNLAGALHATLD